MLIMNPLHILCFGNSITAGYINGKGWEFHPYGWKLLEVLQKSIPSTNVTTDIQGNPGDQVVSPPGGFLPRMDILYEETQTPYNWTIILGGTNDLAVGRQSDDIWTALKKVYEIPLSHQTKVLALTVPETDSGPELTARRNKLNTHIKNHRAKNFYVYDFNKAFPYDGLSDEKRRKLWSDGVHPSALGYDVMGKLLATELYRLISGKELEEEEQERPELKLREAKPNIVANERIVEGRTLRSGRVYVDGGA